MNQETDRVFRPGLKINTPFETAGKISSTTGIAWPRAKFCEQQNAGTAGGTFTSGADQQRVLNTTQYNTITGCSLAANVVTVPAGTYKVKWRAPAFRVNVHHSWLANNVGGATLTDISGLEASGCSRFSANVGPYADNDSIGECIMVFAASTGIKLMHRCTTTEAIDGFGVAVNLTLPERFSEIEFEKIA